LVDSLVFHLIPHTHWDREWYLPRAAFAARLVGMLDDLIDRLEADPAFRSFLLDGQTVLLTDYLAARPDRTARVQALVRAGRLQTGPWYVLPDEQIPSVESLVRNLLLGRGDAERLGGRTDVLYSPDAFGHPAVLPDLAREFALEAGVLWRGLAPAATGGRDLVHWRGAGGDLLVYLLPPAGYESGSALFRSKTEWPAAWRAIRDPLVARAAGRHVAVFLGADHHWAHPDVRGLRDRLAALEPGHDVRVSRLDEFLRAAAEGTRLLPVVCGELRDSYGYTWTLQGVHGTRAPLKRRNSAAELTLERIAEPLAALASPHDDLRALLGAAWRALVANHFHDAIAGCSSDAVAREMAVRLTDAEAVAGEVTRRALHRLTGHVPDRARETGARVRPALALWNPAPRSRSGVVLADTTWFRGDVPVGPPVVRAVRRGRGARPFALVSSDGRTMPVQAVGRAIALRRLDGDRHYPDLDEVDVVRVAFVADAPALGFAALAPRLGRRRATGDVRRRGAGFANALVEVSVGRGGALALRDRSSGERFEGILRLEGEADAGDTYTFCTARPRGLARSTGPIRTRVLAAGPLVGALESRWSFARGRLGVRLVVRLHAGSPIVHCRLEIDNRATDHRLRARLPTGLAGCDLLTGAQHGALRRMPARFDARRFPAEVPVATAPAHRFVAASLGDRGLALLFPGFAEVEWTIGGDLWLTLLRAVGSLSRSDLPVRPGHAAWPEPTPLAQCRGPQVVELALMPGAEAELGRAHRVLERWEDAFLPVRGFWLPDALGLEAPPDSIALEGDGLVCSAVKPAEASSGVVLRCYNPGAEPVQGRWRFGVPRRRAWRVRMDERGAEEAALSRDGRVLAFRAPAGVAVTYLVD
jgi:2-O-(6-phospho-alpha-D-mannosyl)-D-glycerate hydrolase